MKLVAITDYHHEVLGAWAQIRETLPCPPAVWTLDFHTDTMPCFRGAAPPPHPGEWKEPERFQLATASLRHDEHFDWALRAGLISRLELLSCVPPPLPPAHERMCCHLPENFPALDRILNDPETIRPLAEKMLESDFLSRAFGHHLPGDQEPYILDIDCDYFLCRKALYPGNGELFRDLAAHAAGITISRESDWVRLLRLRGETITGGEIAAYLQKKFD